MPDPRERDARLAGVDVSGIDVAVMGLDPTGGIRAPYGVPNRLTFLMINPTAASNAVGYSEDASARQVLFATLLQ